MTTAIATKLVQRPVGDKDRTPVKVAYNRQLRPDWSNPGECAENLRYEIMDLKSRPDLLGGRDMEFLRQLGLKAIRGPHDVWLSPMQHRRLMDMIHRQMFPAHAAKWRARKDADSPTYRSVEGVNEHGEFQLKTFAFRH